MLAASIAGVTRRAGFNPVSGASPRVRWYVHHPGARIHAVPVDVAARAKETPERFK